MSKAEGSTSASKAGKIHKIIKSKKAKETIEIAKEIAENAKIDEVVDITVNDDKVVDIATAAIVTNINSNISVADLKIIVKSRNITTYNGKFLTEGVLNNLKRFELIEIIVNITDDEFLVIKDNLEKRAEYKKKKLDELKIMAKSYGLPVSGAKDVIIDNILSAIEHGIIPINFDDDQLKAIEDDIDRKYVWAGPGCGKTTIIGKIMSLNDDSTNIVLVYNKNSKNILKTYMKKFKINFPNIFTIDEYCFSLNNKKVEEDAEEIIPCFDKNDNFIHKKSCNNALMELKASAISYNLFILDEAQDIDDDFKNLIDEVIKRSKRSVILGDPRQQLYGIPTWFINNKCTHFLRYNYRSSSDIVSYLNDYSKKYFKNLHFDMIATLNISGYIKEEHVLSTREIAELVRKDSNFPKNYIIAPLTIEKLQMKPIIQSICQHIFSMSCQHITVMDGQCTQGITDADTLISTVRQSKGSECENLIILDNVNYLLEKMPHFIFTAISRAKRNCTIVKNIKNIDIPILTGKRIINIHRSSTKSYTDLPGENDTIRAEQPFLFKRQDISKKIEDFPLNPLIMTVDIESVNNGNKAFITEIAAIVYKNNKVIDIFRKIAPGIEEFVSDEHSGINGFDETDTGLRVKNYTKLINSNIGVDFMEFHKKYPSAQILRWSGSDEKSLGLENTIDVHALFKTWLLLNNMPRISGTSLQCAVNDLYGFNFPFVAHRAFEDAIMTYGILTSII